MELAAARHASFGVALAALGRVSGALAESGRDEGAALGVPAVELVTGIVLGDALAVQHHVIGPVGGLRVGEDPAEERGVDPVATLHGAERRGAHGDAEVGLETSRAVKVAAAEAVAITCGDGAGADKALGGHGEGVVVISEICLCVDVVSGRSAVLFYMRVLEGGR